MGYFIEKRSFLSTVCNIIIMGFFGFLSICIYGIPIFIISDYIFDEIDKQYIYMMSAYVGSGVVGNMCFQEGRKQGEHDVFLEKMAREEARYKASQQNTDHE
jgi:hypothetical protein